MSMGIVTDDDIFAELERLTPRERSSQGTVVDYGKGTNAGRTVGHTNTPEAIRKIIGENRLEEGREATKVLTDALGLSIQSADAYAAGASSPASYNNPVPALRDYLTRAKERIAKKASNRVSKTLDLLTEEKLKESTAKELSSIAKDLSGVIKNMEPNDERERSVGDNTQFIVYAPRVITNGDKFPVIHVEE